MSVELIQFLVLCNLIGYLFDISLTLIGSICSNVQFNEKKHSCLAAHINLMIFNIFWCFFMKLFSSNNIEFY